MRKTLRNRALIALAAGTIGALVSTQAQTSRTSTLVYGGNWTDLITLDPGVAYEFSGSLILDNVYETLVKFEGTDLSDVKPGLATSWNVRDAGADGWKITFRLRNNIKFSNGRAMTANDVVYTVDRAIQLKGPSEFLFTEVGGLKVGSTRAVNPTTVEFTLPKTASPSVFLNVLTFNIGGVVDSTELKARATNNDFGSGWLKTNSAGTGPFVVNRWDQNQQVVLDANPNSRLLPKLQRIILKYITEANAQKIALESGEIDIAEDLSPEMVKAKLTDSKFQVVRADTLRLQYLGMNSGPDSPFADNRIRQAVRYAIDQDGIVGDLLQGAGRKMQTIIPAGLLGANTSTPYKLDLEKARALMREAGKPNGFDADFMVFTGTCGGGVACADLGAKIQNDLGKIGIRLKIQQIVQSEGLKVYRAQKAQLILVQWSPDYPDPDGNATPLGDFNAKSLAWRNVWNNATASKLAQQAGLEPDPKKRAPIYKQLTDLIAQEGPYAVLFQPFAQVTMSNKVQGYVRNAQSTVRFEKISKNP
jgi:peptide/nickel transport system substrate-binding protein